MCNFWVISFSISIFSFLWVNENEDKFEGSACKSSLPTSSISITWELFRNSGSLVLTPRHTESETLVLGFSTPCLKTTKKQTKKPRWVWCRLTFDSYCLLGMQSIKQGLTGWYPHWAELPTLPGPPAYLHPLMWWRNTISFAWDICKFMLAFCVSEIPFYWSLTDVGTCNFCLFVIPI